MNAEKLYDRIEPQVDDMESVEQARLAAMILNGVDRDGINLEQFETFWGELTDGNKGEIQQRVLDLPAE